MPKQRITKEMVVNAAFEIARNSGMEQVMVKNIAEKLGVPYNLFIAIAKYGWFTARCG